MEYKFRAWDNNSEDFSYSDGDDDNYVWGFEKGKLKCWAIVECGSSDPDNPPDTGLEEIGDPELLEDNNGKI